MNTGPGIGIVCIGMIIKIENAIPSLAKTNAKPHTSEI